MFLLYTLLEKPYNILPINIPPPVKIKQSYIYIPPPVKIKQSCIHHHHLHIIKTINEKTLK